MEIRLRELTGTGEVDLGRSGYLRVDQARIDAFAEATEDRQWIHVDAERAAATPQGGTIAHGFLLLSLVPKLFSELVSFPDAGMVINYGLDKVRFIQPVVSGSRVCLEARIVSVSERENGRLLRVRANLRLESGRRAMVAETLFLVRPGAAEGITGA